MPRVARFNLRFRSSHSPHPRCRLPSLPLLRHRRPLLSKTLAPSSPRSITPPSLALLSNKTLHPPSSPPPTTTRASMADESHDLAIAEVERLLGYTFNNKGLISQALTHPSYPPAGPGYEPLLPVGEAAISLAITKHLTDDDETNNPDLFGVLLIMNTHPIQHSAIALRRGLHRFLRRGPDFPPELDRLVQDCARSLNPPPGTGPYLGPMPSIPPFLYNVVRSIAGALHVDCGMDIDVFWNSFRGLMEPLITPAQLDQLRTRIAARRAAAPPSPPPTGGSSTTRETNDSEPAKEENNNRGDGPAPVKESTN